MCSSSYDRPPSPSAFLRNMAQPMPLARKVKLLLRNEGLRIIRLKACCGHPGEPGC